jgi:glycosyltransferase 2 family protein
VTATTDLRPAAPAVPGQSPRHPRAAGRVARWWRVLRPLLGAGLLAAVVLHLGTGPFRAVLGLVTPALLGAALVATAVSTLCCAARWRLVAGRLGLAVPPSIAVAAYYRSQLLNATLPGGVAGDVHRAVRHGTAAGGLGLGLRSVGWERAVGQVVQVALALTVLVAVPSPVRPTGRVVAVGVAVIAVGAVLGVLVLRRGGRFGRAVTDDVRRVAGRPRTAVAVALLSVGAAGCHAVLFVLVVRATGAAVPVHVALVLALLVLVASSLPTNVAGWGPREGAAAAAFAAAGASAADGVTAAALYGVLALVGTLPGLPLLVAGPGRPGRPARPGVEVGGRDG